MEDWNLTKYDSPYLAISGVRLDEKSGEVLVAAEADEYVIEHQEGTAAQEIVTRLDALRSPNSTAWRQILSEASESHWYDLLKNMDYLGLLRDAVKDVTGRRDSEIMKLRESIALCIEHVLLDVGSVQRPALLANVRALSSHCQSLMADFAQGLPLQTPLRVTEQKSLSYPEILGLGNFYQQLAFVLALYQRNMAPLSLACCTLSLLSLQNRLDGSTVTPEVLDELLCELAGGAYSTVDAQRHLNGLAECLVSGADSAKAPRFCVASYEPKECLTGLQFMLEVERVAGRIMKQVGVPEYLKELRSPTADRILVDGRYLQDYYVTTRFPEIITAILPKRLNPALRARAFRYYTEEVGHDVLEYQSCRELGLTDEQIQTTQPLPLHYAYVDVFTQLGVVDPVAYAVSIFITEGVLGAVNPLDEPYKRLVGQFLALDKHILLNEKYHHTSIPRLFMADVKSVSPATQRLAMSFMMLVMELNYRAWDDLLAHYWRGEQRFLRVLPKVSGISRKVA